MNTVFSNIANARITDKPLNKVWMDLFMSLLVFFISVSILRVMVNNIRFFFTFSTKV